MSSENDIRRVGSVFAGGPEPGDPQLRPEAVGERLELVQLVDVVACRHDAHLERAETGIAEMTHGGDRCRV